jgi:hypothetical protein
VANFKAVSQPVPQGTEKDNVKTSSCCFESNEETEVEQNKLERSQQPLMYLNYV